MSVGRGLAPAEACERFDSEGTIPFPTFVLSDNLFAKMPCGYDTINPKDFGIIAHMRFRAVRGKIRTRNQFLAGGV